MLWHSCKISFSNTGSLDMGICRDSILFISKISLISFSRCQPARRIWVILACWLSVSRGNSDSINWANPRMAFSGLLNSWLMLDRKSDLARLAFSAMARALSSSLFFSSSNLSRCFRWVMSRAAANTPCRVR